MLVLAAISLIAAACSSSETRAQGSDDVLRLGIFPNLTHAPGYVALEEGIFEETLPGVEIDVTYFNSGSDAGSGDLLRFDRRHLHRARPGHRAVPAAGEQRRGRLRRRVRRRVVRRPHGRRHHVAGRPRRQEDRRPGHRQHAGRRAPDLAARPGPGGQRRRAGRSTCSRWTTPSSSGCSRPGSSTARGSPSRGPSLLVAEGVAELFVDEADLWPDGDVRDHRAAREHDVHGGAARARAGAGRGERPSDRADRGGSRHREGLRPGRASSRPGHRRSTRR